MWKKKHDTVTKNFMLAGRKKKKGDGKKIVRPTYFGTVVGVLLLPSAGK